MSISFNLYQLQKIDSQIAGCNQRLSTIQKEMEGSLELKQARSGVEQSLNQVNISKKELGGITDQVDLKKIKIEQSESTLYSGKEANPKLLQDLQTEIVLLKKQLLELNDELLEKMILLDEAERRYNNANVILQGEETKFNTTKALLTTEKNKLELLINRFSVERKANVEQIPSFYLIEYKNLIENKQGVAIATLQDMSCSACGTTFTPSQCQLSRSQQELFHCPTCHRIVYGG